MVLEPVLCPVCGSNDVVKHDRSQAGKQRYKCLNSECQRSIFIQSYAYRGYLPEVKQQITEMAMNGSGIRDTARVLKISPTTVIEAFKKRALLNAYMICPHPQPFSTGRREPELLSPLHLGEG